MASEPDGTDDGDDETHLGSLSILEAGVDSNGIPVNLGLSFHVLDDCVEQEGLLGGGLLAALASLASGSRLGDLGRHVVGFPLAR